MGSLTDQFAGERLEKDEGCCAAAGPQCQCLPGLLSPPSTSISSPPGSFLGLQRHSRLPLGPLVIDLATDFQCPGDGSFPNLENGCDSFFMCSGDKQYEFTCNPGLKFDGSIGQCDWEQEVDDNCNWDEDAIAIGKQNE